MGVFLLRMEPVTLLKNAANAWEPTVALVPVDLEFAALVST